MGKDNAAIERHLKSIDDSLKRLVKFHEPIEAHNVTFDKPKRLTEPATDAVRPSEGLNERDGSGKPLKRLTEPGEPPTGGEGEYLLNPDGDTSGS